jgi:hypothetical protein
MKRNLFLVLISLVLVVQSAEAQKKKRPSKSQQDLLGNGEYYFDDGQFARAIPYFSKLAETDSTNAYYHYKMGICYLNKSDEKERSITELELAHKMNPSLQDITFYLGRAYHLNNKFDEAIDLFNRYLSQNPSAAMKKMASHYIEYCQNGKILIQNPIDAEIVNVGSPVNSAAAEYAPVISSDESTLIFTYRGERSKGGLMDETFKADPEGDYYEDIMISQRIGSSWLTPEPIGDNINTIGNDASIALSADGQTLFTFKSTLKDKGDIFKSTLKGADWTVPVRLGPNINSNNSWEGSCSISSDGQLLYFASDRKGGFGGRDIYVSKHQDDGDWGPATNLGPAINTEYDEDAPFIHPDGIDLFFSSKGHNSMGGYDIMYSTKTGDTWSEPINLGYPLNTTEDERYYVLTASGEYGYFSTDRKGTLGDQDIYTVTPGFQGERPILALVIGTVTANDKPADATIRVTNTTTNKEQGVYNSNTASGKFLIALTPGNEYKVAIEVEGMQPHIEYVNVKTMETFVQVKDNVKLYSAEYAKEHKTALADTTGGALQAMINQQMVVHQTEMNFDQYEAKIYRELLKVHGEDIHDSVEYNVEYGRFQCPKEFDPTKFASLGLVQSKLDFAKNMIYFTGPFKTLLEAELLRQKALKIDPKLKLTAVTVNDKASRKTIQRFYASEYKRKDYIIPADTKLQLCEENRLPAGASVVDMKTMVKDHGNFEADGLNYRLELGVVENEKDFNIAAFEKYGKVDAKKYPDGKIHYSMGPFKSLKAAADFKDSLVAKEAVAAKSIIMVFEFGKPKTVQAYFETHDTKADTTHQAKTDTTNHTPIAAIPCDSVNAVSFAWFVGKDLNDKEIYGKLIAAAAHICPENLSFTVQIGAYRHPQNFKHKNLSSLEPPPAKVTPYADGITRFTMREFKTIDQAEAFRQTAIKLGTKDAWITASYKGERKLLQECIANNFWAKVIN